MLRASTRAEPEALAGSLRLSFQYGVQLDANRAAARLEALRKVLHWEVAPVVTPAPVFFERLYQPFTGGRREGE